MSYNISEYVFFSEAVMSLQQKASEVYGPEIRNVLQSFYENLKDLKKVNYCNYDVLPYAQDTYEIIVSKLSYEDTKKSFDYIYDNYERIISVKIIKNIIIKHPKIKDLLADKIIDKINKHPENVGNDLDLLFMVIQFLSPEKADLCINKIFDFPDNVKRDCFDSFCKDVYAIIPAVRGNIFKFLVEYTSNKTTENLFILYSNLYEFAKTDDFPYFSFCIKNIEQDISNTGLSKKTLGYMIKILAKTYQIIEYKEETQKILKTISAKEDLLDINIKRSIARITEDKEDLRSSILLGQRVEKTPANKYGYVSVEEIPIEKPCILIFGGSGVDDPRKANNNMGDVRNLLKKYNLEDLVDVYSVIYNFGDPYDEDYAFDDNKARKKLMFQYGRRRLRAFMDDESERYAKPLETTNIEDVNPRYVQQIFDIVFLPRISQDGHRIDVESAKRNIRNINIYAHCHGGYTFIKVEELMQQKMVEFGYTKQEIQDIQKQLLCVAYAPYCPLGVSKSTMISFISARDGRTTHYNLMGILGRGLIKELSWFPDKQGNAFVVPQIAKVMGGEIDEHGVPFADIQNEDFSDSAKVMLEFREQALINGAKGSLAHQDLVSVHNLVTGGNSELEQEFIKATINGGKTQESILDKIKAAKRQGRKL